MSSVRVRPFRRSDRDQLTQLVNAHAGAVVPGMSVSVNTVLSSLERRPGEFIEDPWVSERVTLVPSADATERQRFLRGIDIGILPLAPAWRQGFVSDVRKMLSHRPELFGQPFSEALQDVMRGPSEWSVAERELFAAFVSAQNQCPF